MEWVGQGGRLEGGQGGEVGGAVWRVVVWGGMLGRRWAIRSGSAGQIVQT